MEVIFFTYGDSTKASTWSNVPYLMSSTLEKKGVKVNRVDISPNRYVEKIYNSLLNRHLLPHSDRRCLFNRTQLFEKVTNKKIKKAVKKYSTSDFCIFLNFDFYNSYSSIPSLLFSDWTYRMLLEDRLHKKFSTADLRFEEQQSKAISNAAIVLPLFSESARKMRTRYPDASICSIPFNVINDMSSMSAFDHVNLDSKFRSNKILFIGGENYKSGLQKLIKAMSTLGRHDLELDVIGINKLPNAPAFVNFHGYLHKDIPQECTLYYKLLNNARCIVNPTPRWAAYSSLVEAMYFYTPVIVSPFNQFVEEFGDKIDFGYYVDEGWDNSLTEKLTELLSLTCEEYLNMAKSSHRKVKDYTWDRYVDEMIKIMNEFI